MTTGDTTLLCIFFVAMATEVGRGFVLLHPMELLVREGSNAVFTCSPLYTVALPILERDGTVYHDSKRLTHSDHGLNTPQGFRQYQLSNVSRHESGTVLRCYMGGFFSNTVTLSVYALPVVDGRTGVVTLIEEDPTHYVYNYIVTGYPPPHNVSWLRDGVPFYGGPQVNVLDSISLTVHNPHRTDTGNYTILAVSTVGQASLSLILNIVYNEFTESPQNATVTAGDMVHMRCVHVFSWAYAWFSNQGPLYHNIDKVTVNDGGRTLLYGPVDHRDHLLSVYCIVHIRHSDKLFVSSQATLSVYSPPVVLAPSSKVTTEGSNVLLEFSISSRPPATHSDYLYNSQPLNNSRLTLLGTSLFISNVSWQDAGSYTLTASNTLGQGSNTTLLTVLYAPVVLHSSQPIVAQVFRPINITCGSDYHGNPEPQVTWTTPFGIELHSDTGQLHISESQYRDSGLYVCTISNALGSVSSHQTLLVLNPPGPPKDIGLLDVGSTWVLVTWETPANPVTGYIVTVTPLSSESGCEEVTCENVDMWTDGPAANVTGLIPSLSHLLSVSALANGSSLQSSPSPPLVLTTDNAVPGIGEVVSTISGPGRCVVTWSLAYSGGSPVTHFNIQYQRLNNSYWRDLTEQPSSLLDVTVDNVIIELPSNQRYTEVHGLESLTVYLFRVRGANILGQGAYSTSLPVLSHQEGVPNRPAQPRLISWGDHGPNLHVQWSTDNAVDDLLVLALAEGDVIVRHTFLDHSQPSQVSLIMDTYRGDLKFQVVTSNRIGVSESSPLSLPVRDYVTEVDPLGTGRTIGLVVGVLVGVVNCVVMATIVTMWAQMCYVTRHNHQSKNAVSEPVTESPISARMMYVGNMRPSPDSDLELSSPRRLEHFVTMATATPPTPFSITSLV